MTTLLLTARDMDLLAFLALNRECTAEFLAERFFTKNPFTGARNANPLKPCSRRLRELRDAGYVDLARVKDASARATRLVARVAQRAENPLDERAARRTVNPKERIHHLRTLDAVRYLERAVAQRGGRVVDFRVEAAIRAQAQRGRRTRRGDSFEAFPDAVCTVAYPSKRGERLVRVALEYVTNKYADADIAAKHDSFAHEYDEALWFADKQRTVDRVRRITGGPCSLLT